MEKNISTEEREREEGKEMGDGEEESRHMKSRG